MNTKIIALLMVCALASMSGFAEALGQSICEQPRETGMCRGDFTRYGFDPATKKCVPFVYGGCGGNLNNFRTKEECIAVCGQHNS